MLEFKHLYIKLWAVKIELYIYNKSHSLNTFRNYNGSHQSLSSVNTSNLPTHHYHLLVFILYLKCITNRVGRERGNVCTFTEQQEFTGGPVLNQKERERERELV